MKIVFIVPASLIRRTLLYRIGGKLYGHTNVITGPLILGTILKQAGHEAEVYEELEKDINFGQICADADVVGIYAMTSSAPRAYELADCLRRPGRRIIIGGIHPSSMPEEASIHADQVIIGEAENVILNTVEGKIRDKIIYAPPVENLDAVPFPDYSILKTPCDTANIMTTRGCPFACSFCTTTRMFHPYRQRSIDSVIEELRYDKQLGFQYMNFEDDNFTADPARTKELLRRMIREHLTFKETFFFGRTDMGNDEEMLELLHEAHLNRVLVGIESLNQKSLDSIHKRQKLSDIERCAKALEKHKIRLIASLVLGLDDDTAEDIRRGVRFCRRIHAYQLQPAVLTPFPGTPVYQQLLKSKRMLTQKWQYFDMMNVTFRPVKMTAWQLQKEFLRAVKKFYNLPSAFTIMRIFGISSGFRRLGLWLVSRSGILFLRIYLFINKLSRYRLNHHSLYHFLQTVSAKRRNTAER